jgi:hypothetical protein
MENQPQYKTFTHWFFHWVHNNYPEDPVFFEDYYFKLSEADQEYIYSGYEKGYIDIYIDITEEHHTYNMYKYYDPSDHGELTEPDDIMIEYNPIKLYTDMHLYMYPDDLVEHEKVLYDMGVLSHQDEVMSTRRIFSR